MKWTITAGELLQIVSILFGGFTIYNRISLQIRALETKIDPMWQEFIRSRDTVRHWKEEQANGD